MIRRALVSVFASVLVAGTTATPAMAAENSPPNAPTEAQILPDLGCAAEAPGRYLNPARLNDAGAVVLGAKVTDPDAGDVLEAEYATWPVGDPAARQTVRWPVRADGSTYAQVADWYRAEGTYAWTVRAHDGTASSEETAPCYLTVDRTAPASAAVTSTTYPTGRSSGGYQKPGDFTFSATTPDVAAYRYRFDGNGDWTTVQPAALGGPVTITHVPQQTGDRWVQVHAVDRANNHAWETIYRFTVFEDRPRVFSARYQDSGRNDQGGIGVAGDFDLSSNLADVASYTYSFNGGEEQTVVAVDRRAKVTFTPTRGDHNVLKVRSTSSTGEVSPTREYRFMVDDSPVVVTWSPGFRVGTATTVSVRPRLPGTVSYSYWATDWSDRTTEPLTAPAAADGTGALTWTPDKAEYKSFHVRSRDASGHESVVNFSGISVDGAAPVITRSGADNPGVAGTFSFGTTMENPVEYEYSVNGVKQLVPAGPDGRATVSYTPDRAGYFSFGARARNAAGIWTSWGNHSWEVTDRPVVTSDDFPHQGTVAWRTGKFTFQAKQPAAVEFEYVIDGVTHTVAVGPDATATVDWTPTRTGWINLYVKSRTAAGVLSQQGWRVFNITP